MSEDSNNQLEEVLIALRMAVKKDDEETVDALKKQLLVAFVRIFVHCR